MRSALLVALALFAMGCEDTPAALEQAPTSAQMSVIGADNVVGAIVLNRGEATEPYFGSCQYAGRPTNDVTIVATANGGAIFKCDWAEFAPAPDFGQAYVRRGWECNLSYPAGDFYGVTDNTTFVLSQSHHATVTCIFQDAPVSGGPEPQGPPSRACYGDIVSGIANTWPWAHDGRDFFAPPPGAVALWIQEFGPFVGISNVRELQMLFCG